MTTEFVLPGKAGRLDIFLEDSEGFAVAIENKVLARPDRSQLHRYEESL